MKEIKIAEMQDTMYESLVRRYQAQAKEAEATLLVYLNNYDGIGEHPQVMEEMRKQVEILANAEDCIETLKRNFG